MIFFCKHFTKFIQNEIVHLFLFILHSIYVLEKNSGRFVNLISFGKIFLRTNGDLPLCASKIVQ